MLTRVIFNQKGGVGKSSIAVNLAAISAEQGHRTLLIDLDAQCNSTQYVLGEQAVFTDGKPVITPNIETFFAELLQSNTSVSKAKGLFNSAINNLLKTQGSGLGDSIHKTQFERLSIIPASPILGEILHQLESKHKIYKLRDSLNKLSDQFDRVYIDTPPAFNFFTLSALIAANRVIVPFDCDVFSKRALQTLLENIIETREDHNDSLTVEGIVVNQYDPRANLPKTVVQSLLDEGLPVFDNKISPSVIMKESHHQNLPLVHLNNKHKLSQQFLALYQEMEQA